MRRVLILIAFVLLTASLWLSFTMGKVEGPKAHPDSPVRNIVYAHVPSSITSLACFVVLLVAAIGYLRTNRDSWDRLGAAAAEVGVVFATVLNATGSIFSRAEWGDWWTPTPRLVSAAILWFLYVVYLILRTSLTGSRQRRARVCAVFAIIAFLDVPMVIISARFLPDMHRASFGFTSGWQRAAFFTGMAGTLMLAWILIWMRTEVFKCKALLEEQE